MTDKYKQILFIGMLVVMLMVILLALTGCRDPFNVNPW
jgi:hypothetical protein